MARSGQNVQAHIAKRRERRGDIQEASSSICQRVSESALRYHTHIDDIGWSFRGERFPHGCSALLVGGFMLIGARESTFYILQVQIMSGAHIAS